MPFKSEAQRRYFHVMEDKGDISPSKVHEWEHETPKKVKKNLPYHVKRAFEIKPEDRTEIPKKDFAQPNKEEAGHKGKYPIPDKQHAKSALGFAKMHGDKAALSAVKAKIRAKFPDMDVEGKKKESAIEKDLIPGGKADSKSFKDFPKKKIREGEKVEKEHTDSSAIAKEIASDHLTEDKDYYKKLKKMEKHSSLGHITGGAAINALGRHHSKAAMEDALKRLHAATGREKQAMSSVLLRAFSDELSGISKTADMLTRRNVAASRGQAAAKMNAPHPEHAQMGFQFGNTVGQKPQQSVHPPLIQQQRVNQGIAKEQFHERARRAAMSAAQQPEQTSLNLKTKAERQSAKKARTAKPVPSKTQKVLSRAGGVGKKMLGAGVGLAGAGLLGAGLIGHQLMKQPEEQQQRY